MIRIEPVILTNGKILYKDGETDPDITMDDIWSTVAKVCNKKENDEEGFKYVYHYLDRQKSRELADGYIYEIYMYVVMQK